MKQFLRKISYTVLPLLLAFYVAVIVYEFYIYPRQSGDLGRLGRIGFGNEYNYRLESCYLKNNMVDDFTGTNTTHYDIITIGSSFSRQGIFGYQNYLAHLLNQKILNINMLYRMSSEQMAIVLLNSGLLTKLSPKIVIVESVERHFISQLSRLRVDSCLNIKDLENGYGKIYIPLSPPSTNSLYETIYWLRQRLGLKTPVKHARLAEPLFTVSDDDLYFYYEDLNRTSINDQEKKMVFTKLDSMKRKFDAQNIKFLYVVAADKYDMYEPYILDDTYPRNTTLEQLDSLSNTGYFINTEKIMRNLLKNGVKDLYMANDSHWSYKASEVVAKEIALKMAGIDNKTTPFNLPLEDK